MTSHSGAAQAQGFSTHVEAVCAEQQSQQYLYNAYEEAELVSFLLTPKPEMQEPIFFFCSHTSCKHQNVWLIIL